MGWHAPSFIGISGFTESDTSKANIIKTVGFYLFFFRTM